MPGKLDTLSLFSPGNCEPEVLESMLDVVGDRVEEVRALVHRRTGPFRNVGSGHSPVDVGRVPARDLRDPRGGRRREILDPLARIRLDELAADVVQYPLHHRPRPGA